MHPIKINTVVNLLGKISAYRYYNFEHHTLDEIVIDLKDEINCIQIEDVDIDERGSVRAGGDHRI